MNRDRVSNKNLTPVKAYSLFFYDRGLLHYSQDKGALGHNYRKVMAKIYGC